MNYTLSNHVKERAKERGISSKTIDQVIISPDQIIEEEETGQKIYQSIIAFPENKTYLVRVFVNNNKEPSIIKSVYRTSKIDKYYEGEI
ncbi:DUF4258 domain-containing protein [Spirosoma spitsbergense]|uniref:DUF4258 domain-containing protein n=1 Tax=Spirosoma spitsbergense TaxID=431554 RepID=UPI000376FFB0|nr:DUF4258 domain-containing protein [Spirosoma spitsbergense]